MTSTQYPSIQSLSLFKVYNLEGGPLHTNTVNYIKSIWMLCCLGFALVISLGESSH